MACYLGSDFAKKRGSSKAAMRGKQTASYSETERTGRLVETTACRMENPAEKLTGSCLATRKVLQTGHGLEYRLVSKRDAKKALNLGAPRAHYLAMTTAYRLAEPSDPG